jgi:hypothetical protein
MASDVRKLMFQLPIVAVRALSGPSISNQSLATLGAHRNSNKSDSIITYSVSTDVLYHHLPITIHSPSSLQHVCIRSVATDPIYVVFVSMFIGSL